MAASIDSPRQAPTVQLLTPEGRFQPSESAAEYIPYLERLTEAGHKLIGHRTHPFRTGGFGADLPTYRVGVPRISGE